MIYEFACYRGHVIEASVPMGTSSVPCDRCVEEMKAMAEPANSDVCNTWNPMATRILSPTRTTFKFADTKLKS